METLKLCTKKYRYKIPNDLHKTLVKNTAELACYTMERRFISTTISIIISSLALT
jgi:ribosomal protein L32E